MSNRYQKYMQSVQPTDEFLLRLEGRMNRELRRSSPGLRLVVCAAAAAVLVLACTVLLRPAPPDILRQPTRPTTENLPSTAPDPTPEVLPTATPEPSPTSEPASSPTPESSYPPDEIRLELEWSDESAFAVSDIVANSDDVLLFENHLVGADNSSIVEICQSSVLNSVVDEVLRPGTAYWPHTDASAGDVVDLTDKKGKTVGYAERVTYLNPETNTLKDGWKHTIHANDPLPETPDNPVERIQFPGKVRSGGTPLRYGMSADAPVVAVLEEGQKLGLGYRVGNWVYASTAPFCKAGEAPVTGWMHITEVLGMHWRVSPLIVDLLADEVNLRETPGGKVIAALPKNTHIRYGGATIPHKTGSWHFVSVVNPNGFTSASGYISAEYSKLNTFRLGEELNMDGVVSASLSYSETTPFGAQEQSVDGEKLRLLLERLTNAYSELIETEVCGEGAAFITLTYADGHTVDLPISGDGCTQVRHGDVTYDLKTDEERTERFLNDGGVNLADILGPIFDKIKFH